MTINLKDLLSKTWIENTIDLIIKVDPIMIRNLKFKIDQVYRDLYESLARLKQTGMDQFLQS